MVIAGLILIAYAMILTLAPSIRQQSAFVSYKFDHWLGVLIWGLSFSFLHHQSSRNLPKRDPYLLPIVSLLTGMGLMTIWRLYPNLGLRQSIWIVIASLIFFAGIRFPAYLDYIRKYKYIWLISGLVLTAMTIFFGANPIGSGPKLWLRIFGVHIQPSEFLKLLLIAYLAGFFADRILISQGKLENLLPNILVTSTALLLLIFQHDLGSAIIFLLIYLAMLFATRGSKLILWIAPVIILVAGVIGYFFIDIVRLRIDTWLNPFSNPTGASYQIIQSMIAIAEGKLIGTGPGLGSPNIVPVSVSDFIFSAIAEELGFLGATIIILLLILLLYRGIKMAISTSNAFYRFLTLGLIFYFGIQSVLIIGGNIGFLPLTGVTLPFVSYGGSSLLVSYCAILILLSISHLIAEQGEVSSARIARFVIPSGVIILLLITEIILTSLIAFWFSPPLTRRAENPRWIIDDRLQPRGEILDRNNQVIFTNTGEPGDYQRESVHIPLYPVIGYTNATYGQTGIEESMFPYLRGLEGYPFFHTFLQDLLYNLPFQGLNIRLTIDLNLQHTVDSLLENTLNGSIPATAVLMNANSGEILAMASHPYFDAMKLESEWESLLADKNAPLINRATQGLYPPGAALLPFVVTTQIDLIEQSFGPQNVLSSLDQDLNCAGFVDQFPSWDMVITQGCQSVQGELSKLTGINRLLTLYQDLGFFTRPELHLNVADPVTPQVLEESNLLLAQAPFKISPLQMAMAASAITNNGILPGPRIVNAYQDSDGNWITFSKFTPNTQVLPANIALRTAALIQESNSTPWQVTAQTLTEDEQPITWFIAGTNPDWKGQPITIVLVLEADAVDDAQRIGGSIIGEAMQLVQTAD